ncbi:MAG: glycosyltransferase family 2 protein [Halobacteriovoraceae bacterium]|nr:glycosyltransferase family 2 protein [Halobacteriovoraceae bacterium]MBT5094045.1 glycosyltransferase family 2 protein [Halobacteriovoraceae bacterium]
MHREKDISIVVPAFNEEKNLEDTIDMIEGLFADWKDYEILIVDDGSKDQTLDIAHKRAASSDKIRVIIHHKNLGRGTALNRGFNEARFEYLISINAKKDTCTRELSKIIEKLGCADLVLSYQLNSNERPVFRYFLSVLYLKFVNTLFGLNLKYYNGSSIIPKKLFESTSIKTTGYAYETELLVSLLKKQHTYCEVGVVDIFEKGRRSRAFRFKNIVSVFFVLVRLFFKMTILKKNTNA